MNRVDMTVIPKMESAGVAGAIDQGGVKYWINRMTNKAMTMVLDGVNQALNSDGNPTIALQSLGNYMIGTAEVMMLTTLVGEAKGKGILAALKGNLFTKGADVVTGGGGKLDAAKAGGDSLITRIATIALFLALPFIFVGLMLAFYCPSLPFIYWVSALTGWAIMLIEAVFAAPLWMAAHATAEGDGVAGRFGERGYMLVLSLIARPPLMVAGLFGGMLAQFYMTKFLLVAYMPFVRAMHIQSITGIVTILAMVLILMVLSVIITNKSFSLIYEIPDRVLSWIGGGAANLGENSMERESNVIIAAGASMGRSGAATAANKIKQAGQNQAAGDRDAAAGDRGAANKSSQADEKMMPGAVSPPRPKPK